MAFALRLLYGALRAQTARSTTVFDAEITPSFLQLDRIFSISLINYQPDRGLRGRVPSMPPPRTKYKRRRGNVPHHRWIKPELDHTLMVQERLTEDNAQFLQQVIKDTYLSPLKEPPPERQPWTPWTKRAGLLCKKIGVVPQWTTSGRRILTTLCQVVDNHVVSSSTSEEFARQFRGDRYKAKEKKIGCMVVGAESIDPTNLTDEYCQLFEASGVQPKRKLTKFVVSDSALLQPGTRLRATHFRVGDYVDVGGRTIDYGFQGVMKRWGFKGGPASHGATKFHRRPGSIGHSVHKSRVMRGKKMPGHMGNQWRIQRGLKILRMNTKYDVIYLRGPTPPGLTSSWIYLWDTILPRRKAYTNPPPMPTHYPEDDKEPQPEEIFAPELFRMDQPTIVYEITEEDLKQQRTGAKTALKAAPKTAAKSAAAAPKAGKAGGKA